MGKLIFDFSRAGDVLCSVEHPIPIANSFLVEVVAFDVEYPLIKGAQVMVHINNAKSPGVIKKLEKLIDKTNGQLIKKNPKCVKSNECALIEIRTEETLCLELFSNLKSYGRVAIREKFKTVAVGVVVKIL